MNSNMINPANYYNPFAKYNYVSKTRGAYVPQNTSAFSNAEVTSAKSANIWDENYDADTEVTHYLSQAANSTGGIWGIISGLFSNKN